MSLRRSSIISSRIWQIVPIVGLLLAGTFTALAQKYPSVSLTWDPELDPEVAGYRIYVGGASGDYTNAIDVGLFTSRTIPLLAGNGTYYFAVTAYNFDGLESDFSNEVNFTPIAVSVTMIDSSAAAAGPPGQNRPPPQISLQWQSDLGTVYHVLYKNSLADTNWSDLSGEILATSPVTTWSEPILSTVRSRFYCVMAVH